MANRTQLEDCRRSRKLDAEYNRTVISNLSDENAMLREALKVTISNLKWAGRVLQVPATSSYNEDIADAIAALSEGE